MPIRKKEYEDMKRKILGIVCLILTWGVTWAAADKGFDYEILPVGGGADGMTLVEVVFPVKKVADAVDRAKEAAVHGIVFKGYASIRGVPGQSPLFKSEVVTEEQKVFFSTLFSKKEKKYAAYVVSVAEHNLSIQKTKKGYRVKATVSVDKRRLRKALEDAGMIRSLDDVFK